MPGVLDDIRSTCALVAGQATSVRIDADGLAEFATRIDLTPPPPDPGQVATGDDEATAAFVMSLDAINFGSGYFPYLRKREGLSGYHTVATAWREYLDATGPVTASRLRRFAPEDCAQIFGQTLDSGLQGELMHRFTTAFIDLGHFVDARGGTFAGAIEAADGSAERLVTMLDTMPFFHDRHPYRGLDVALYKRAQITAHDLSIAFGNTGLGAFADLDRLTMFADNLVPHVLRVEGVLVFADDLVARIDAVEDIPVGSEPEVEIRACGVHAVEELVRQIRHSRDDTMTAGRLDNILWNRGADARYKAVPRHRTRCVFY